MSTVNDKPYAASIAIDWADTQHELCLLEAGSNKREYSHLDQDPECIHQWVASLRQRFNSRKIGIAIELSKGPLIYALMRYDFIDIYPVNPTTLAKFRAAFTPSGAKDDRIDVDYIMDIFTTHSDKLSLWQPGEQSTRALVIYSQRRRETVNASRGLCNRIRALLKSYYPQALQLIADNLASPMSIAFLRRWPSLDKLKRAKTNTLRNFYYEHRSRSSQRIEKRLKIISEAIALTDDTVILETSEIILKEYLNELSALTRAIAQYDRKIAEVFKKHKDASIFLALPGAGAVLAPRLAAVMGTDRERFEQAKCLQQFSGIAPVIKASGTEKNKKSTTPPPPSRSKQGTKVVLRRYKCSKFVLQTFHEFAGSSIPYSIWANAYYEQQREKGAGKHQATRALAYKWQRIIFRCWKNNEIYDETKYIQTLRKHQSPIIKRIDKMAKKKKEKKCA